MAMDMISGRNGGYPCIAQLPELSSVPDSSPPYPEHMMRTAGKNGGYPSLLKLPELSKIPGSSLPYPEYLMCCLGSAVNDGYPCIRKIPGTIAKPGAFCHAEKLVKVSIPESVKKIGKEAFRYTALKKVRIAADCEYYDTSFPEDCEISYYGGGGPYVMLEDKDGYTLLDKTGAIITIRSD